MTDGEKLDLILLKLDEMGPKFDKLEEALPKLDKLDEVLPRLDKLEEALPKLDKLEEALPKLDKLDEVLPRLDKLDGRMDAVEKDVSDIKMIIENEIRVNIQRIAEGHLDLSRNLHEAMKPGNEVEMLAIKVRTLESDVREIKRKIS